jgi:hypothetical protein
MPTQPQILHCNNCNSNTEILLGPNGTFGLAVKTFCPCHESWAWFDHDDVFGGLYAYADGYGVIMICITEEDGRQKRYTPRI